MKISTTVSEFLKLSKIKDPTTSQTQKYARLRRELSARGLDPQHINGLEFRALVYDNRPFVENYLSAIDADDRNGIKYYGNVLKNIGIRPSAPRLRQLIASFKTDAKAADKKKNPQNVNLARAACDAMIAEITPAKKAANPASNPDDSLPPELCAQITAEMDALFSAAD